MMTTTMRMRMMTMMMMMMVMMMVMMMMMMGRKRRRRTMTMTVTMTVTMSLHHMHLASFLYRFVCAASHDDLQRYVFNHPIDFHFIADSVANWPQTAPADPKVGCVRADRATWLQSLESPQSLVIGLWNFKLIHQECWKFGAHNKMPMYFKTIDRKVWTPHMSSVPQSGKVFDTTIFCGFCPPLQGLALLLHLAQRLTTILGD